MSDPVASDQDDEQNSSGVRGPSAAELASAAQRRFSEKTLKMRRRIVRRLKRVLHFQQIKMAASYRKRPRQGRSRPKTARSR
jgi:hypothetical protein